MANPRATKRGFSNNEVAQAVENNTRFRDDSFMYGLANMFGQNPQTQYDIVDPNSVNPYAGAEPYQAIRPGAVTATPSDIAAMGAIRNGEALVDSQIGLRRGATLPNGALLNPYEGVYNPVVKAPAAVAPSNNGYGRSNSEFMDTMLDDLVAPAPKSKPKPKPKRKAKRTTQAKAPVVAPVIQEVRASDPKPSHAQRLAMLDPHYANDDEYGYTY